MEDKIRVGEAGDDLKKLAATVLDVEASEVPPPAPPASQSTAPDAQVRPNPPAVGMGAVHLSS